MSKWSTAWVVVLSLFVLVGTAALAKDSAAAEAVFVVAKDMKWTQLPSSGPTVSVLWGDPTKGAHGSLVKIPAGKLVPLHVHAAEYKGVIVSGELSLTMEGATENALGPGSYFFVPAGGKHTTKCLSSTECIYFLEQPGAFDTKIVTGTKK